MVHRGLRGLEQLGRRLVAFVEIGQDGSLRRVERAREVECGERPVRPSELGTALRQGALSVTQLEIMPRPPKARPENQPWPTYPMIYRVSSAHEEGGERVYAASTEEFLADDTTGAVRALRLVEVAFEGGRFAPVPGTAALVEVTAGQPVAPGGAPDIPAAAQAASATGSSTRMQPWLKSRRDFENSTVAGVPCI